MEAWADVVIELVRGYYIKYLVIMSGYVYILGDTYRGRVCHVLMLPQRQRGLKARQSCQLCCHDIVRLLDLRLHAELQRVLYQDECERPLWQILVL